MSRLYKAPPIPVERAWRRHALGWSPNGREGVFDATCPICAGSVVAQWIGGYQFTLKCENDHDQVAALGIDPDEMPAKPPDEGPHEIETSWLTDFTEITAKPVHWAWQDRIALSKITALAGRPKIGKGLLYSHLISQVTRGRLDGDLNGPRDVILVTTEDDPGDTLKPRLMAAAADLSRVSIFQMGSQDEPVPFRVPQDAAELGRRVEQKKAALVVIDPLLEFIDGKVDSHKSHPVRQAIAALNQIARDQGCAVLVIFHLNKGASTDPLLRHEASAAFTQVVRGGLMLGNDPDDPDGEDGDQRVLAVSSSNLAAIAPSLVYEISTARVIGDTGEEIDTAKIDCIGESAAGAPELLKGTSEEQRTVTDEAVEFLRAELADGARLASEIKSEARKLGLSDMALFRGRQSLGVKASKTGFRGGWEWVLHEDSSPKISHLPPPP
jgi:AAA domain